MRATRVDLFVFLTIFLDLIGFGIVLPLLPIYVRDMGGSAETVGILFACFSLTQLLASPWMGRLSDRFGRRPVILISLTGNAVAMVVFALATRWSMLPLLFVSRIAAGATSGNIAACQAAIADAYTGDERAQGMGRVGAAIGLGMVCGPIAGSTLAHFGAWVPPLGAAALALIDLVAASLFMPETRHLRAPDAAVSQAPSPKVSFWTAVTDRRVAGILLVYFLLFFSLSALQVTLPLEAQRRAGWGPVEIGRVFGAFGLLSLVVQGLLLKRLVAAAGARALAAIGNLLVAIGMFVIVLTGGGLGLGIAVLPFGLGFGLAAPVLSTLASELAPPDAQGGVLGMSQSAGGLARTIGPLWVGVLQVRVGPAAPFASAALAALAGALVVVALARGPAVKATT